MQDLKENRIEYLQGLSDWDKYGKGWTSRTNRSTIRIFIVLYIQI